MQSRREFLQSSVALLPIPLLELRHKNKHHDYSGVYKCFCQCCSFYVLYHVTGPYKNYFLQIDNPCSTVKNIYKSMRSMSYYDRMIQTSMFVHTEHFKLSQLVIHMHEEHIGELISTFQYGTIPLLHVNQLLV